MTNNRRIKGSQKGRFIEDDTNPSARQAEDGKMVGNVLR